MPINSALKGEITRSWEKKRAVIPARNPVIGLTKLLAAIRWPPRVRVYPAVMQPAPNPTAGPPSKPAITTATRLELTRVSSGDRSEYHRPE